MIITENKITLDSTEIRYVVVSPFNRNGFDEWCEKHGIEYIEDTITDEKYNGDPEHSRIFCYGVFKYDNRYWLTNFKYSYISGIEPIGGRESDFEFFPVKRKEVVTYEWVKE